MTPKNVKQIQAYNELKEIYFNFDWDQANAITEYVVQLGMVFAKTEAKDEGEEE